MDLIELGRLPISDAKPGGDDARYEPEYEALQAEIDKLSSASAGGGIHWKEVVKQAYVILSKKSKDLKVASYLAVALFHLKGAEGLSIGTQILLDLVSTYWDTLYPVKKRMRGRFNAVTWWADNAEGFVSSYDGDALPATTVAQLSKRVGDLDAALAAASEDAPMLNRLQSYVDRLPTQTPEAAQEQEAEARVQEHREATDAAMEEAMQQVAPQPAGQPAPTPAAAPVKSVPTAPRAVPSPVGDISSHEEYRAALKTGLGGLSVVADYLLTNDPMDRVGYRLRRVAAWLPIPALPPADKGVTRIPPPEAQVKAALVSQLDSRDFASALMAAESRVGQYLFWLDLSRFTAEALDALGGDYRQAKLALESEVALFAKRLSGIETMTFADGTPFADTKTKTWLRSLNRSEGGRSASGGGADSVSAKAFAKAEALAKDKKIFDAVSVLQDSLNSAPSGRERFLLRLGMIRLLTDVDQPGLAHAHVEEVLERITDFRLELWEPELALDGYTTAYEALMAEEGEDAAALAAKTLRRIGRINPAAALKINGLN